MYLSLRAVVKERREWEARWEAATVAQRRDYMIRVLLQRFAEEKVVECFPEDFR